jgi:hypothetical protein
MSVTQTSEPQPKASATAAERSAPWRRADRAPRYREKCDEVAAGGYVGFTFR